MAPRTEHALPGAARRPSALSTGTAAPAAPATTQNRLARRRVGDEQLAPPCPSVAMRGAARSTTVEVVLACLGRVERDQDPERGAAPGPLLTQAARPVGSARPGDRGQPDPDPGRVGRRRPRPWRGTTELALALPALAETAGPASSTASSGDAVAARRLLVPTRTPGCPAGRCALAAVGRQVTRVDPLDLCRRSRKRSEMAGAATLGRRPVEQAPVVGRSGRPGRPRRSRRRLGATIPWVSPVQVERVVRAAGRACGR